MLLAGSAQAGAPLKGVDVKLGRSPGGGASARTTNAAGKIELGVLPAGSYYLIVSAPKGSDVSRERDALVEIRGAAGGTVTKRWSYAQKKAFDAASASRAAGEEKIIFTSDGVHPLILLATAATEQKGKH